ncbi:MAG: sugar transferase [Anaerolineaceae bacterium]|jgi:exopolysaccharide biosynthesis polyprenyl glycosylphosphotransferase
MFRRFSANFAVFSVGIDIVVVDLAMLLAALLRQPLNSLPFVAEISTPVTLPLFMYFIFPIIWVGVMLLFSVYDGRRNLRAVDEFGSLTLGALLAAVAMAGILYFTTREVSRFLFLSFVMLAWILALAWRAVMRMAFRWNVLGAAQNRRILILGAGTVGHRIAEAIEAQAGMGLILMGYLDDDPQKQQTAKQVLGSLDIVRDVIAQRQVDDVVVALPLSAHQRLNQVVAELHDLPVKVWVIPDYFSLTLHRASVEEFAGIPMLDLRAPALSEYQRIVKRAFDLAVSLAALPFVLLPIGICALAIKLDSPGPVFYRSRRVGENGKLFDMLKFRTMVQNADDLKDQVVKVDEHGHMFHKLRDDPRITRVGKFLRRTSVDEWPQLINVIKGEMSLVGPRPEMPWLVEKYELWQRKRFAVPQGMTGWWQINGRSDKPMHLNTQDDLYYVQHYSIWLDLQILFKTAWIVLRGKGAF